MAEDGSNLGVLPTEDALRRAQEKGLDLVEVNPKGTPPVCKILDFGKYKYEEKKKQREAKRKQTVVEVKEIKLRPKTDDHDLDVKVRHARKFLEAGNKVKFTCRFRGREITHPEIANRQLEHLLRELEELANIEQRATMEGRTMAMILSPKPQVLQKLASERAQREREAAKLRAQQRAEAIAAGHDVPPEAEEPEDDMDDQDEEDYESAEEEAEA